MIGIIKDTAKGCKIATEMMFQPKENHGHILYDIVQNEKTLNVCKKIYKHSYKKFEDNEIPPFLRNVVYYTKVYYHIRKQI